MAPRLAIDRAGQSDEVCVSALSCWEVALRNSKGQIAFSEDVGLWRRKQLAQGMIEIPVDGNIGIRATLLQDFPATRPIASLSPTAW